MQSEFRSEVKAQIHIPKFCTRRRMAEFAIQCQKHEKELDKVRAEDHEQKMAAFKNA